MTTNRRRLIVVLCCYFLSIIFMLDMSAYSNPQETFGPAYIEPSETANSPSESLLEPTKGIDATMVSLTEKATEPIEETTEESTEVPTEPEPEVMYFDVPLEHDLQLLIFNLCEERGIDPAIIIAMIYRESSFRPHVIGDSGRSYGLMQIMPRWNKDRMKELGCNDLLDPYQNVTVGIDCFADYYDQSGSIVWSLMAYNGGPSYANRLTKEGRVSQYAKDILNYADSIRLK